MRNFYACFLSLITIISTRSNAQIINTICGGYLSNGDSAKAIGIVPNNQVIDKQGNIYIAEYNKHIIRKLSKNGVYSVIAGTGIAGFSGDGGQASKAQLSHPYTLLLDNKGNLYITDNYNQRVRKVDTNGIITTIAGNGIYGYSGDGGLATAAAITGITGLSTDKKGNLYLADLGNDRIRKIDKDGIISTVAGTGAQGVGGDGGPATSALLVFPIGVTVDSIGELFIPDVGSNTIRKVASNGIISTIAGKNYQAGFSGDGGLATLATFNGIAGNVAVDGQGNIYIPDTYNNRIRKINQYGIVNTIAGNGTDGNAGDGDLATNAEISLPTGVITDAKGNIYISTSFKIRRVDVNNIIHTVAGNGSGGFNGNGILASKSQLYQPRCVTLDNSSNIYVVDAGDFRVRRISANGIITTIAGNGEQGFSGDGGLATLAQLSVYACATDKSGNIFIADLLNERIRKINKSGIITTIAGNGIRGFSGDGGLATNAELNSPDAIAIDNTGNIYIADRGNQRIRKINKNGIITTIAGNGTTGFSGDGGLATSAEFYNPLGLVIDDLGNVFVADAGNNRVRRISVNGIISTVAGNGNSTFSGDGGKAISAGLSAEAVAIDSSGNILIADAGNDRIRKVDKNGIIQTIAGGGGTYGDQGPLLNADIPGLTSIAVDKQGNIYLTDVTNHRLRKITNDVLPVTLLNFNAVIQNNNVLLAWQTANETNVQNFVIERSIDAKSFNSIGTLRPNKNKNYSYVDTTTYRLKTKTIYYRLKIFDNDGKQTYSMISSVELDIDKFVFSLSPNPAKDFVRIKGNNIKSIIILDLNGKILKTQNSAGNETLINVSELSRGAYIIKVASSLGYSQSKKLIVQ